VPWRTGNCARSTLTKSSRGNGVVGSKLAPSLIQIKNGNSALLIGRRSVFGRVVYHVGSSHFFGIGIYPVSDTAGIGIFRSVLLYCKLWREHIFKFLRELFFWKILWEFLFFFKRRVKCTKRGPRPPLLRKKGAPANLLRGSRQIFDTEKTTEFSFGIGMVNTEKYRPIPTEKYVPTR